ncbi:MAG: B12-binding domain-containing radical SAM protein [Candidatus Sulfotelmatobacter sp.]
MVRIALVSFDVNEGRLSLYPPLNLCVLATVLQRAGYETRVFDFAAPFSRLEAYYEEIRDFRPGLIGMACFTPYVAILNHVSRGLRKAVPDAAMVIGGYHPTILAAASLETMPQFDYAMQGECDRSIIDLARMIDGECGPEAVAGLVYRDGTGIRMNRRDEIRDLDSLPVPDRSFLDRYYRQGFYGYVAVASKIDLMITSRGCPYECSFCFKVERRYRFRGVDSVMAEFDLLKSRGIKHVHIMDDAFTANKKRCHAIADRLIAGKYGFRLKVRSRVNSVDEELLGKLKRCGVRQIVYGIESGSQAVLDCMKKHATVEMNARAIRLTNRAGIFCTGDIMVGMPAETRETIEETVRFLRSNQIIIGSVPYLYPLPGTAVHDAAKLAGTLQGDWTLDGQIPWVRLPWTETRGDLEKAALYVERSVHRNPARMLYFLWHNPQFLTPRNIRRRAHEVFQAVFR